MTRATTPPWSPQVPELRTESRFHTLTAAAPDVISGDADVVVRGDDTWEVRLHVAGVVVVLAGDATESSSSLLRRVIAAQVQASYPASEIN